MTENDDLTALERMVWVDMETTGLDPKKDKPLEIGFMITDLDFEVIDDISLIVFEDEWSLDGYYKSPAVEDFVLDMHEKSGLWNELHKGSPIVQADKLIKDFLTYHKISSNDPLCGSSVGFDRDWMKTWFPDSEAMFSYRNIDVSTIKELMMRFSPEIYKLLNEGSAAMKRGIHRVIPDIEDTISELQFYRREFLWVPEDFS